MSPGLLEDCTQIKVLPWPLVLHFLALHLLGELMLHSENGPIYCLDAVERELKSLFQALVDLASMSLDVLLQLRPAGTSWFTRRAVVA